MIREFFGCKTKRVPSNISSTQVEQDPKEIWESQRLCRILELPEVKQGKVLSIDITNQRETTVIWNRLTGEPIYNALVWQDKRTAPIWGFT